METNNHSESKQNKPVKLSPSYYQLTTEDYENIWLRIKDRGSKWFWGWIIIGMSIFSGLFGFGIYKLYSYGKKSMDDKIAAYVQTPEFKNEVKVTFESQFTTMTEKLKLIDEGLAKLAIYQAAPYKVTDYGFILVDSKGTYIIVEFGNGKTHQPIQFKSHFSQPPKVIATLFSSATVWEKKDNPLHITNITSSQFQAVQPDQWISSDINWIAIGK